MTPPPDNDRPAIDLQTRIDLLRQLAATAAGTLVTCASGSMEPAVRVGEQVRIGARPPRVGDVALFVSTVGTLILHRLVLRIPGTRWWLAVGDRSSGRPGVVHERAIIGVKLRAGTGRDR